MSDPACGHAHRLEVAREAQQARWLQIISLAQHCSTCIILCFCTVNGSDMHQPALIMSVKDSLQSTFNTTRLDLSLILLNH